MLVTIFISCMAFNCLALKNLSNNRHCTVRLHSHNPTKVVVVGATGRTGTIVVRKLQKLQNVVAVCVVKDVSKARQLFGEDRRTLSIVPCDLDLDPPSKIFEAVRVANAVIYCSSYTPSGIPDLLGPYKVDFIGAKKLIDACNDARVQKIVFLSSLLANGFPSMLLNRQYLLLNAFGGVLTWKRKAEKYLASQNNIDYTIIRPGGLKDSPSSSPVLYGAADSISSGSLDRDTLAEILIQACFVSEASNKIVEVVVSEDALPVTVAERFGSIDSVCIHP